MDELQRLLESELKIAIDYTKFGCKSFGQFIEKLINKNQVVWQS
jgi:hypothetical protein